YCRAAPAVITDSIFLCSAASKGEQCANKPGQVCEQRRTPPALRAWRNLFGELAGLCHPAVNEKHYRQLPHRLGTPLIREVLAALRREELSATVAAEKLGLGRTRLY